MALSRRDSDVAWRRYNVESALTGVQRQRADRAEHRARFWAATAKGLEVRAVAFALAKALPKANPTDSSSE